METDKEKIASTLRYMKATGDLSPFPRTVWTLVKITVANWWRKLKGVGK